MSEAPERDINEVFDDIAFTEDRLTKKAYEEGYQEGLKQGSDEGYKVGFNKGIELGEELGDIFGTVVAHQQLIYSDRIQRQLEKLRTLLENFPKENDPEQDIIGEVEKIRNLYKQVQAMLAKKRDSLTSTRENAADARKDYSF